LYAGRVAEYEDGSRKVVSAGGTEIGVFQRDGRFYAYENFCLHQGGPVCEGVILGKVEPIMGEDRGVLFERYSEEEIHLICPWHGWEYDISTGECVMDRRLHLKKYEVVQRGEEVYVIG
jgi:nitrite reductase (NADH) small subunit